MSLHGHNSTAFDNWYFNGPYDTWWCEPCQEEHANDEACATAEDFYSRVQSSGFSESLASSLISDDAVDMTIYLATHSVEPGAGVEVNEK